MCRATTATSSSSAKGGEGRSNMSSSKSDAKERSSSRSSKKKPAFEGATFDADGNCLRHRSVQLAEQVKENGRLVWAELRMNCPKCQTEHHKSRRVTSLGGAGKVKRGRTVHGMSNPLRYSQKSGRHMDVEFDTPFDDKGRCHHHPNVQMASKKVRGGWKLLMKGCPKCIEAKYDEDVESLASSRASSYRSGAGSRASSYKSGRGGRDDDEVGSVSSRSTKRSVSSRTKAATSSGKFDKNGCCTRHPTVQVAKKKLLGGWKEYRACPKCLDPNFDDMADNASVSSRRSTKSATSFRSTGTAKSGKSSRSRKNLGASNSSRKGGGKTDRYGALPFDGEGFCHSHPGVRLAKKKALGGWKVLHDICPDCAHDASSNAGGSVRSRSSRRSSRGTGRYFDDSGSDASSRRSGKSGRSTSSRKKKIRVKDMKHRDEEGRDGRYSGDVDEDHQPHGQGKMKYKDGSVFVGVWSEGSQVHGKTTKGKSKGKESSSSSKTSSSSGKGKSSRGKSDDWARRDGAGSDGKSSSKALVPATSTEIVKEGEKKKTVRRMKWMDYYGDPGEYTGEVDAQDMPNGRGSMKYDHGLIQEGVWTGGQFVEGSDLNDASTAPAGNGGGRSSSSTQKKSSSGRSGSSRKPSSSKGGGSSSRRLDP